jgi:hypothetical protein|tara:strand:+ start:509 stop:847 length:339 start_codon:yes stop_codon:yes gene_type:complete
MGMVKKFLAGKRLTERETHFLYMIRTFQYEHRYSPTQLQLAEVLGVTRGEASYYCNRLIAKGFIEMSPNKNPIHARVLFPKGTVLPFGKTDELPQDIFPSFLTETLNPEKVS